ncbi:galactosyltransferase-related protein [Herbiconiux sp. CPCC 203407]|uniref:Galactosyltransferase-related protein n=1 Tax=Herbiconiux oxytropis TaxID=2970915 RepID=A0AA41XJ02_9MICO|nr:galactosyltransferase-related protein [Herbiconiux oxytropis]MCS5721809.1 galactosyltransferase-related protein [Herbiconiux oxytropis]MCS5727335.1 galactosyltransferase-related protein [Herbiconiux oxytropis]
MSRTAVITIVHGRRDHLLLQRRALDRAGERPHLHIVVAMDDEDLVRSTAPELEGVHVVSLGSTDHGLPLARARNLGAATARALGADVLAFLDVDCVPGQGAVAAYARAAADPELADRLLCGPVTYLTPAPDGGYDLDRLEEADAPHPARPAPAPGEVSLGGAHELFWSLSFALTVPTWSRLGGFSEEYVGYGGEDTDFAYRARDAGVELAWIGSARAYHQHHPVSSPPFEHLDEIIRNATIFHRVWGTWPMTGWLDRFEELGLVVRSEAGLFRA